MTDTIQDYEIELPFDDVGLSKDGAEVGMFSGAAHIDQDGYVVGLVLDTYTPDEHGKPKKGTLYLPVPPASYGLARSKLNAFWLAVADDIATQIENDFSIEIEDLLNAWRAAREYYDREDEDREPNYFVTAVAE